MDYCDDCGAVIDTAYDDWHEVRREDETGHLLTGETQLICADCYQRMEADGDLGPVTTGWIIGHS